MSIKVKQTSLGLTCLLLLASGCAEVPMFYHGNTVSSVPVVVLQEGRHTTATWETFDLIIDYKYIQKGDSLEISGQAALSQHYQMTYANIPSMDTYIFFLDKDSRVLKTAIFVSAWTNSTDDIQDFSKSYHVPTGTTGISFGYSGQVQSNYFKSTFYELPLK